MLEFLWFLAVVGALIGLSAAGTFGMRIRWGGLLLVLPLMALLHMNWEHGPLRVMLNLLLFFQSHTILIILLLGLSLLGVIFAWHGQLTRRAMVGGVLIGAGIALLLVREWYCVLLLFLTLSMAGLLWTGRRWLGPLPWVCAVMIVYLATGLFISHKFYGGATAHFMWVGIALGLSFTGMLWAVSARRILLASLSGIVVVMLAADLVLLHSGNDVPALIDTVGDYVITLLCVASIIAVGIWTVRVPRLQPLGWVSALMLIFLGGGLFLSNMLYGEPEDFADIEDQFKYGSIGSDHFLARGIPYFVWQALPQMFSPEDILTTRILPTEGVEKEEYRPRLGTTDRHGKSYEAFGLLQEEEKRVRLVDPTKTGIIQSAINRLKGRDEDKIIEHVIDRPIGFSKRRVFGLDFVGINCAFCHTSTIRKEARSKPEIVLGMPANTVDIELFFLFLFGAAQQNDFSFFSSGRIMNHILEHNRNLKLGKQVGDCGVAGVCQEIKNALDRLVYRWLLIPLTGKYARGMKKDFYFIDPTYPDHVPRFGPGRVDAWSPGKTTLIAPPLPVLYPGGIIDTTSIWNQKARDGMRFHWDGNTDDLNERNIIAGLVVNGPQLECLDVKRISRITDWIKEHPAPRYDDYYEPTPTYRLAAGEPALEYKREQGRLIFQQWCATCHAQGGERVGRVEPLDARELATDPARMKAFTAELQNALNTIERDADDESQAWKLRRFRMQDGYVNVLLDGIWLRAPYLHNGSVPTLRDLLNRPCEDDHRRSCRPKTFYRGQDIYDPNNLGFTATIERGDRLSIIVDGKTVGNDIVVNEEGWVVHSGINGLDGKLEGRTADDVARDIDRHQHITRNKIQSLLSKGPGPVPLYKIIAFLQSEEHLTEAEVEGIRRSVRQTIGENKMLLPETMLQEGFARKPLVMVQIHKQRGFLFDTGLAGNHNRGHLYGTDLSDPDKQNLLEFLKTL